MSGPEQIPHVPGFSLERDPHTGGWIATSGSGRFTLRGRSEAELNADRWRLWSEALYDCRSAIAELFPGWTAQTPAK
ncbi:hypothetical protein [Actinomadura sp. DC4]|uniref:hypothetical protein n=1 Tax=Actinomadura sp. DC4 TaxID=3055069 RepID=UPI0025B1388A|nr:hypothetical protein [Actinomadura sp. DC4]MDN3353588.1 hypothetical protein [Actinomadura sp. DC4]